MPDAFHDSSARYPPPRCHPRTRKEYITKLTNLAISDDAEHLLWMFGPAGAGKSAVAQTSTERLAEQGMLGGSRGIIQMLCSPLLLINLPLKLMRTPMSSIVWSQEIQRLSPSRFGSSSRNSWSNHWKGCEQKGLRLGNWCWLWMGLMNVKEQMHNAILWRLWRSQFECKVHLFVGFWSVDQKPTLSRPSTLMMSHCYHTMSNYRYPARLTTKYFAF